MIADCLSRLVQEYCREDINHIGEDFVRFIAQSTTPVALSTHEVEVMSGKDPQISVVRQCIETGD